MTGHLNLGAAGLAWAYLVFVFLAALGTLQIVATRERLIGLSLLGTDRPPEVGQILGVGLIVGTGGWFFISQWPLILRPGLAGTELLVIFAAGSLLALLVSLAGASVLHTRSMPAPEVAASADTALRQRLAAFGPEGTRGWLRLPAGGIGPWPAVCLVPSPIAGGHRLDLLAEVLAEIGIVTLVIDWSTTPVEHPDVLAIVPTACEHLSRLSGVAGDRVAAIGFDLGADLVLRAVRCGQQPRTAVALAPLINDVAARGGLGMLREVTYRQALRCRRSETRRRLLGQADGSDRPAELEDRPVLVVYGADDGFVVLDEISHLLPRAFPASKLAIIPRATHLTLPEQPSTARLVVNWLRERG